MQTFYENQTCVDRRMEQELAYRVDFCWSTLVNGAKGVHDDSRQAEDDSSFYEEDDRFEPSTSYESESVVFKGVPNGSLSQDFAEDRTYLQARYNNGDFESMHKCSIQTTCLNKQLSMHNTGDFESSRKRQADACPSTKRRLDIERRNSRERIRVRAVNEAFVRLRRMVPSTRCSAKRVSKRSTLVRATEYIRELQQRLADASFTAPQHKSMPATSIAASAARPGPDSIMMKIDKL